MLRDAQIMNAHADIMRRHRFQKAVPAYAAARLVEQQGIQMVSVPRVRRRGGGAADGQIGKGFLVRLPDFPAAAALAAAARRGLGQPPIRFGDGLAALQAEFDVEETAVRLVWHINSAAA